MKLFVLTIAVLLLSLQAVDSVKPSVKPENILTNYVMYDTEIKNILEGTSTNFDSMNAKVKELMSILVMNITDLRTRYGIAMSESYQTKYEAKFLEINRRPKLNENCKTYVEDILKMNKYHQRIMSETIITALKYWKEGYDKLDKMISDARVALMFLEKNAHECGKLFDEREYNAVAACVFNAYHAAGRIRFDKRRIMRHPWGVERELEDLSARTDHALEKLYKDLKDVFRFYQAETMRDEWLIKNCSESPGNITKAT